MSSLFISYRRDDSVDFTGLLYKALERLFGKRGVVYDQASIPPGVDFREFISGRLRTCDVVIAVIGPNWKTAEKDAQLRLEQENDFVRIELEIALFSNKLLIPLLIGIRKCLLRRNCRLRLGHSPIKTH